MARTSPLPRSFPVGLSLLLVIATLLCVLQIANALHDSTGGGEARISDAYEGFFLSVGLWIVLAIMMLAAGITGTMPRWTALLAVILVPTAAVASVVALDMCSRNLRWAVVFLLALPALVAFYAFWARLPALHAALPAEKVSAIIWTAIFLLSIVTFALAA
ncbi:hypothetical protein SAMN02745126_02725 [Enhydrobacter aerosaccus]|uniref:Uncharacterized protein n=1 Tax=Enhydrobacter aerosaccus TaxID=225324 RepID=A0A1T4PC91_9HYPH|nr:hypothetical protein [Enhydrobacter aerosaccus]SJZ88957.1 hypothetical protein SAMN02745126_02725 [Enhydrobacter aerosaccus]